MVHFVAFSIIGRTRTQNYCCIFLCLDFVLFYLCSHVEINVGSMPLPWSIRMKIALGAAKGLAFLHEEAERPVIYRDFKTSNILLDAVSVKNYNKIAFPPFYQSNIVPIQEYNAKLSDFGLAKDGPEGDKTHVSTRVMGTYGYAAPEYVMTGKFSLI